MLEEDLRSAAVVGNLEEVSSLLKQGAKSSPDTSGRTPIHLGAAAGHPEIVKLLVSPKNVNSGDAVGRTPLQLAAAGGHVEVVNVLLKSGANPNVRDSLHGNTPLHEASWNGFSQTIAVLAKASASLNLTNSAGFAPIHLCCQNGHNQTCRELLLAGANPDVQNNYGDTSLHTSARYGHAGVARILLSAGCKVSEQNKNGDTALHIAAAMGRRKLTTIFLEAGCDKQIRNKQMEMALDIAQRKDLGEIVNIIKTIKPLKPNKKDKKPKKSSETSDSEKRGKTRPHKPKLTQEEREKLIKWSPYGCHYYPDLSLFPQPRLDSLPGEPLSKGEQYYLDLAGNICKGPVGVGVTCHCSNFMLDMESRLEVHGAEVKERVRAARARLEQRVERTEGLLREFLGRQRTRRSRSLDLLHEATDALADHLAQTNISGKRPSNKKHSRKADDIREAVHETNDAEVTQFTVQI